MLVSPPAVSSAEQPISAASRACTVASPASSPMRASSQARSPRSLVMSSAYSAIETLPATEASASTKAGGASRRASASICSSWAWRSRVCASASSSTSKPGATPASSGKRFRSAWQKAWMVRMLMPPGASRTRANRRRATMRPAGSGVRSMSCSISSSSLAGSASAQRPSWLASRLRISAAAALVKVRQRMRSGLTPSSSNRVTRSVSTLVLPVPALASTQAEWPGVVARRCASLANARGSNAAVIPRLRPRSTTPRSSRDARSR